MRTWEHGLRVSAPIRGCLFVGFVGFLTLFFWPVFAQSGHHSGPSCMSHVKQIGTGLLMYAEDYDDHLPRAADWMDATYPYQKNTKIYRCPDLHSSHHAEFGYAFNSLFTTKAMGDIHEPAKALLLYDSRDLRWNAHAPGRTGVANPPRKPFGNTFGFADGHVKVVKLPIVEEPESE